jgi:hypothetical protein
MQEKSLVSVHPEMALLPNLCLILIPPLAGFKILQYIHPKGTYFVASVVNPVFGGTHALTLNKISHFWMDTGQKKKCAFSQSEYGSC